MANIYVDIEDYIDEIETDTLLRELRTRKKGWKNIGYSAIGRMHGSIRGMERIVETVSIRWRKQKKIWCILTEQNAEKE